ncbi:MAG: SIMPL domain-containing protein [Sphingomonas sp.]
MKPILLPATLAALTLSVMPALAQDMRPGFAPIDGTILDVAATGTTARTPDIALIEAGVVTNAATAAGAMVQNAERMRTVLAALRKAGVAERDIQTSTISLSPQYRYVQNEAPVVIGYQASNQVSIRFRDVAKSGPVLDLLVQQGANNISGPTLSIDKPEAAMDEARRDAVAKAKARATLYAEAAGLRVDRILSISEGGAPPPMPMPIMMRAQADKVAASEVAPGEQQVNATISVRFLLK